MTGLLSFDEWFSVNCNPPENYSFAQYGRYIEGWRKCMPWAHSGMSLAYDRWAESRWDEYPDRERLMEGWKRGMAIRSKAIMDGRHKAETTEDSADLALSLDETFLALICMASHQLVHLTEKHD